MKKLYRLQVYPAPTSFNSSSFQIVVSMALLVSGKIITLCNNMISAFFEAAGFDRFAGKKIRYIPVCRKDRTGTFSILQNRLIS